jgi:ubiquinone/menaquinone biosynthesis C-methylase UbiE
MSQQERGIGAHYLQQTARLLSEVKQHSYALMRIQAGQKILDVGCGIGTDTVQLARLVGPSGHVMGIDASGTMIAEASRSAAERGSSMWTNHELGDAASLRFETGSFDACRSERLFQHLWRPQQALTEMVRVTKTGGWIVVLDTDWGTLSIDSPELQIERKLARFLAESFLPNGYSGRQLRRLFKDQKLEEISVEMIPLYVTHYATARALGQFDELEEQAINAGIVNNNDLRHWHQILQQADDDDVFLGSVSMFLVAGRKR